MVVKGEHERHDSAKIRGIGCAIEDGMTNREMDGGFHHFRDFRETGKEDHFSKGWMGYGLRGVGPRKQPACNIGLPHFPAWSPRDQHSEFDQETSTPLDRLDTRYRDLGQTHQLPHSILLCAC